MKTDGRAIASLAVTTRGRSVLALAALGAILIWGLAVAAGPVLAHDAPAPTPAPAGAQGAVSELTGRLLTLRSEWQTGDPDRRAKAAAALAQVAAARQERLAALIADDPDLVLRYALAADVRASLPQNAQAFVETEETAEGDLEVIHEDGQAGSRFHYFLGRITGRFGGRLALHFAASAPALQTGDRVRVSGVRVKDALALGSGSSNLTLLAAALPNTFGAQKTLVILVNFQDKPTQTWISPTQARAVVFGPDTSSVSNFYLEGSYQQTWLTGDVAGVYTIGMSSTTASCSYSTIASLAQQAAVAGGFTLSNYKRYVYAFPDLGACQWWGLGTVGGNPSQAWINGQFLNVVVGHEMGHNLGLYHSHALDCGATTIGAACDAIEYGDTFDVMGSSYAPGHFNAVQKELLGWLNYGNSPPVTTVQTSGVYTIDPYETVGTAPKALKVKTSSGDWYYVEYRRAIGFDAGDVSGNTNVTNGVLLHLWSQQNPNGIYLLDGTPGTSSWQDPAFGVTSAFSDPAASITIAPVWVNGTAGVNVTVGGGGSGPTCVRGNPTVGVSPGLQQSAAGTSVSYTLSVTNTDQNCSSSSFGPSATPPSGWTATFSAPSLNLASGATGSLTLQLKSSASAAPGLYTVSPVIANSSAPGYSGTAAAKYQVSASAPSTSFSDGFDRADSAALGNGWTLTSGSLSIQGGQARNGSAKTTHMAVQSSVAGASQSVAASFSPTGNVMGARFALLARVKDAQNYYACSQQTGIIGTLRISRFTNGAETVLKSAFVASPAKDKFFALGCQVQGTTITLTVNGAAKLTASDGALSTGGVGFFIATPANSSSHRADSFTATVQ